MTRIAASALVGLLLISAPLAAQPAPDDGQPKLGKLLISVAEAEHPRKYSVVLLDLTTGKTTTLIQGGEKSSAVAVSVSPQAKLMAVQEDAPIMEKGQEHGSSRRFTFRSVENPEKIVHTLSNKHMWPVFLDENHVITAGPPKDMPEGAEDQTVIKTVDLTTGDEVDMNVVEGKIWDDVPFQLSPNKRRLVHYRRGKEQRGLYVFDLDSAEATLLSEGGSFFTWAPDGVHGYLFLKKEKKLQYVKVPRGKPLEVVKDFGPNSVLGTPLGKESFLYARFKMGEKFRPLGFEALHLNLQSGAEVSVSTSIPLDEFSIVRCFVQAQETQSFVFVEVDPEAKEPRKAPRRLVLGRVKEGKVERTILLEGKQSIGFPISLP